MSEQENKKNKKINKMSAQELEAALKKTEENMHGLSSKYARALLARKSELARK